MKMSIFDVATSLFRTTLLSPMVEQCDGSLEEENKHGSEEDEVAEFSLSLSKFDWALVH